MPDPNQQANQPDPQAPAPLFDMSKAQPIQPTQTAAPLFDMRKAQPIQGAAPQTSSETLPPDVAARHARANEGKYTPQELAAIQYGREHPNESESDDFGDQLRVGIGKAGVSTVSGLANLANKVLPSSLQIPTEQHKIESGFPEPTLSDLVAGRPNVRQQLLAQSREELTPHGVGENVGATAENVVEWIGGEAALKGLGLGAKLAKMKKVADFVEEYPRIGKLLHIGSNVAKSAAIGATQGAIKGSSSGGEGTLEGAESGAAGGAVGGVVAEAAPVATKKFGSLLQEYAPDFSNALLRASRKANYLYGKNPGQAVIDESINVPRSLTLAGQLENVHGQLEGAGERLDSQIKQTLSDPKIAAKKQDIVPTIQNAIEAAKQHVIGQTGIDTRAYLNELNKLEESIFTKYDTDGNVIGNVKGARLAPAEISDVKKSIGKGTQWNLDPRDPQFQVKAYINSVRRQIYGQLADTVEQAAPEVGKLNSRYANVIEAQGLLENRIAQEHGTGGYNAALRKGEWGTALGLIFSGHPYLGLPLIANRIARSVPGRILESQGAAAAGKALQSPVVGKVAQVAKPAIASNWHHIQTSDGQQHMIHPEDLAEAQRRDPALTILSQPNQP